MNTIQKLRSLELYLAAHPYCEENSECADRLSDVQELLKEIPDTTTQIQADKAELLELMTEMKESFDHKAWVTGMELKSFSSRIESLIQKQKKCQENTPR